MKLFLDDLRCEPGGWTKASGYHDCIRMLQENKGQIEEISLDHDLGELRTGYDVCRWLVENSYWEGIRKITLHSSNPVGVKNMAQLLDRYAPANIEIGYLDGNRNYVKYYRDIQIDR